MNVKHIIPKEWEDNTTRSTESSFEDGNTVVEKFQVANDNEKDPKK